MNGIVIIKKEHGPDAMANVIHICDCVLTDSNDGDEVTFTGKGVVVEQDGMRFIAVKQVDGEDVQEMPDMMEGHEEESIEENDDMNPMNAEDALMNFMHHLGNK